MHKSKGSRASLASQRTARERKRHQQEKEGMKPAVQAKTDYSRNKHRPPEPIRQEDRYFSPPRRDIPLGFGGANPLLAGMMLAGGATAPFPSIEMLDDLFGDKGRQEEGPLVIELDATGDLSSFRPVLAALRGKPVSFFYRHENKGVKLHPFLEFVDELEKLYPIPAEDEEAAEENNADE